MSTPVKATPAKGSPVTDSPGTWRHPRLDEITRRRNATTFAEKNVRQLAYSVAGIMAIWLLKSLANLKSIPNIIPSNLRIYVDWTWILLQAIPAANIIFACLPLVRRADNLSDIPLTPAQRQLLGLPPTSVPPTPDVKFSTPPRYSRTPSIAGSVGSRGSYASSPLSGKGSPIVQGASGSPYSPMGSPLVNKGLDLGASGRRSSIGSLGASFGASTSSALFADPGSPSPSGSKRTSVGLNNKWLYERGRRSSGSTWVH